MAGAGVRDAPPLTAEEATAQRRAAAAILGREAAGALLPEPTLVASLFVEARRYDAWRTVEVLEGLRAEIPDTVPLAAWVLHVRGPVWPSDAADRAWLEALRDRKE